MVQKHITEIRKKRPTRKQKEGTMCTNISSVTDIETGEIICGDCGQVLSEKTEDTRKEWRTFQNDQRDIQRNRVGPGSSLAIHDKGLATVIGLTNKDASGHLISIPMTHDIRRLRIWDGRIPIHGTQDRNFSQAFNELYILKDKLALPFTIVEKSAYIYRKAYARGLIRGRKISTMLASSVYAACRQGSVTRTLNDISNVVDIRRVDIATGYRLIVKELELRMPNIDPVNCISRIAGNMGISERVNRYAMEIIQQSEEIEFSAGKDPMGLAGAALYISCNMMNEHHTQSEIALAANTSTVTIRNLAKGLVKNLDLY